MLFYRSSRLGVSAALIISFFGSVILLLTFPEARNDAVRHVLQRFEPLQGVLNIAGYESGNPLHDASHRKIGKVTMMFGSTSEEAHPTPEAYPRSLRMHEEYAARWGYKNLILRENILDPFWFSKQAYLLSILLQELAKPAHDRLEWLFWADLDVVITNPEIPLSQYLPPKEDDRLNHIHLLISRDFYMINAGTFFLRVSQWSVEYLSAVLALASHEFEDCEDQRAMAHVLYRDEYYHNVTVVPQRWFNAYIGVMSDNLEATLKPRHGENTWIEGDLPRRDENAWVAGDLHIHLAGGDRKPRLLAIMDSAIREHDRLAVPLNGEQINEVEAFWESLRYQPQQLPPLLPHGRADLPLTEEKKHAYLLMLTENHDLLDRKRAELFLTTVRMLTYQILHDPNTRSPNRYPVLILCSDTVPEEHKEILRKDGATVVEVDTIHSPSWEPGDPRWVDNLTKFQAWKLTHFDKIVMIDADIVLLRPLDGVFQDQSTEERKPLRHPSSPRKLDEPALPQTYILAAGTEQYQREHVFPPRRGEKMNAGFLVFKPSQELYDYYLDLLLVPQYWNVGFMDQGLLNYAHRKDGPMPWHNIQGDWNVNWPSDDDIRGGISSIHEKWYDLPSVENSVLVDEALIETRKKMFKFYEEEDVYLERDREQAELKKAEKEKEAVEKAADEAHEAATEDSKQDGDGAALDQSHGSMEVQHMDTEEAQTESKPDDSGEQLEKEGEAAAREQKQQEQTQKEHKASGHLK